MPARDPFTLSDETRVFAVLPQYSLRDQALITLGFDSGFRARELGAMTISHVMNDDFKITLRLVVERRHLKHGRGAYRAKIRSRAVPLTSRARTALEAYLRHRFAATVPDPAAPLFLSLKSKGLSVWQINRLVKAVAQRAGCATDRAYGSHSLRKTFARRVHLACGRDINLTRIALAHTCVSVTQRYLGEDREEVDRAILALGQSTSD